VRGYEAEISHSANFSSPALYPMVHGNQNNGLLDCRRRQSTEAMPAKSINYRDKHFVVTVFGIQLVLLAFINLCALPRGKLTIQGLLP
jgi:hypothetical protein